MCHGRDGKGKATKDGKLPHTETRDPYAGPEKYGMKKTEKSKYKTFDGTVPSSLNWYNEGVVTSVKNQGQCGSCWAFSTAETVESQWAMNGNSVWEFSAQQVASCTTDCFGCGGGDTVNAYEYIIGLPSFHGRAAADPILNLILVFCC